MVWGLYNTTRHGIYKHDTTKKHGTTGYIVKCHDRTSSTKKRIVLTKHDMIINYTSSRAFINHMLQFCFSLTHVILPLIIDNTF